MRIVAHIPARHGSERVKLKNMRPLAGRPLLSYAIEACRRSRLLSEFFVNTESDEIASYAVACGSQVFKRDPILAGADVTQDAFNYDFMTKIDGDIFVLVNPVCPLIEPSDIDAVIEKLLNEDLETVVSVTSSHLHAIFENRPLNFDSSAPLPKTQDLKPVAVCNWAVNAWRGAAFVEQFRRLGYATLVGRVGFFELPPARAVKISTESEFQLAEMLMYGRRQLESSGLPQF